jgi:transposase
MAMLAASVDGVIGVDTHRDTHTAAAVTTSAASSPRPRPAPMRPATGNCSASPRPTCPMPVAAAGRSRAPAATAPAWPASCSDGASTWSRSAGPTGQPAAPAPRATRWTPSAPPVSARPGPPGNPRRRGEREALRALLTTRRSATLARVARSVSSRRCWSAPRAAAGRAAGPSHPGPDPRLRWPARPAGQLAGAPCHRPSPTGHRPAHPAPADRGGPARGRADHPGSGDRPLAAGGPRRRAAERRAGPGQLVTRRPVPVRGRLCRPGRHQPDPGLLRPGDPPSPPPGRRPAAQPRPAHILLVRPRTDPDTRAYVARRTAEGKSRRDAKRCLRRVIARQLFRLLERYDRPGVEVLRAA